jgi:Flp pilus assembly protein TadD
MLNLRRIFGVSALIVGVALTPALPLASGSALAAASGGGSSSSASSGASLADAQAKIDAKNYRGAIGILEKILSQQPKNADALNLMGYAERKLGNKDEALDYYTQALAVDPKHRGANEYLGELYLEMKDLAKAEERLAVLADACSSSCEEYHELKEAIDAFKADQG